MHKAIAASLLAAGLVAGAASPSSAAKPVQEGSYHWSNDRVINPDGSCTFIVTELALLDSKRPVTGWLYATGVDGLPFDAQFRLVDPQPVVDDTITLTSPAEDSVFFAFAPILNKKVLPADGFELFCP